MRKPTCCICENKDADQFRGNREADQRLCFCYIARRIPLLSKSEISLWPLAIFCSCTAWFVSDQVGNQDVGFLMTRLILLYLLTCEPKVSNKSCKGRHKIKGFFIFPFFKIKSFTIINIRTLSLPSCYTKCHQHP